MVRSRELFIPLLPLSVFYIYTDGKQAEILQFLAVSSTIISWKGAVVLPGHAEV